MPDCGTSRTGIIRTSYGTHLLDHLAADGEGFAAEDRVVAGDILISTIKSQM